MQTQNRLLDDLAQLATGAAGGLLGMRREVETRLKEHFRRLFADMDLVSREEFEAVKAMAVKARTEQEAVAARLAALEAKPSRRRTARSGEKPST